MRILNLQNVVLVSLAVSAMAASSACSSSDAARPDPTAGASNVAGATNTAGTSAGGSGNAAGATPGAGTGNTPGAGSGAGGASGGAPAGGGAGGAAGPSVCDGVGSRLLDTTMAADAFIDDFECADATKCNASGVANGWYGFSDLGDPTLNSMAQIMPIAMGKIGKGGQYMGMGAKTPVSGGFGVGLEINLGSDPMGGIYCVDASGFKGVSFWAKAGAATTNKITVGFVVPSQNQVMFGGDCPDATPTKCNNFPQKPLTLTTDWQQYTVEFAGLKGSTGATVVAGKIQQLLFLAPTADWNFSLDEIAYYVDTPPAGAVAPPAGP